MITKDKITEIFCILRVNSARILMPKCKAMVFKSLAEAVRLVILYLFYKFRDYRLNRRLGSAVRRLAYQPVHFRPGLRLNAIRRKTRRQ